MPHQVRLGHDSDASFLVVDHRDAPDLIGLHQVHANLHGVVFAAGHGIGGHKAFNGSGFWLQAGSHHGAAQVAVRNDSNQLAGLMVQHHRDRANIMVAQDFGRFFGRVLGQATNRIWSHDIAYIHVRSPR